VSQSLLYRASAQQTSSLSSHCANARQTDAEKILTASLLGEQEETTRTPSYYMNDDYPTRPEIQRPLPE